MKMEMHTTVKTAIAALLLSGGVALAENNPPATQYQCWNGWIKNDPRDCPTMTPAQHETWSKSRASSTSSATGGAGGSAQQAQQQSSHNDNRSSARTGNQTVNVDNRSRAAASSAVAPQLVGGSMPNCFGDVQVSGSFTAAVQTFGWGVSVGSNKASNICAALALGGEEYALRYLMRQDPKAPRSITVSQPTGRVTCPASHPVYVEGRGCRN